MRNYKIDVLRGISILLVLIHHFNIPYKLHDTFLGIQVFGESLSTLIARNGNYGVTMFFVISGFLITQHTLQRSTSLAQINLKDFYIRRIARIIPCLVLLVAMVTVLGSFGLKPFMNQAPNDIEVSYGLTVFSAFTFWMNILIIENGWVNYALGVLWSLSVEEVFYVAFPVLCVLLGRGKGFILFLLAVICYAPYFRSLHFGEESGAYLYHYFSSFDGIAIGCITALIVQKYSGTLPNKNLIIGIVSALMIALYFYAPIKEVSTWGISAFALLFAVLIFCFAQNPQAQTQSFFAKIMVWIGQRSYEMYLFHLIILGIFKVFYFPKETLPAEKLMLLPIYFILVFILSWAIEKYYSTPLNRSIRKGFIQSE
ncbi:acyltransferase family protein [Acinetobacter sp. WCHAc010052]|uniref:acyltransferase family protein n=1 Tax=Acinetobacter sp. WCHAc010052 TaxID=2004647 RepID=UPI000B3D398A|nr:acyltransferase [Acinetobacter sp. WCHAc010052]AXY59280.1 acyltransferase [Acinetobacter sp. WCHAc010052]